MCTGGELEVDGAKSLPNMRVVERIALYRNK